jgi:hypothetical protein
MYERIRDKEGFCGSYGAVKDYVRPISSDDGCIWEYAYDLLVSLDKKRAIDFLFCLSRADPPVISPARAEQFFRRFGRITITPPKTDRREQAKRAAFEWMRALLQKEIGDEVLRRELGDMPELACLLRRLYEGRLSDRNRSMVVLAKRRGLGRGVICTFLGISKVTYLKYLRTFERGGTAALFARRTMSSRKFDSEAVKGGGLQPVARAAEQLRHQSHVLEDGRLPPGPAREGATGLPSGDPEDHQDGGLPLAQGAGGAHVARLGLLREARPRPNDPLGPRPG